MIDTLVSPGKATLRLWAGTAEDLMMHNPVSVREDATVREGMALSSTMASAPPR